MDGDQLVEYVEKREYDKLERELNEAKTQLKETYDDVLYISMMPEYDQDDAHRLRNLGMKAASKLQDFLAL
jgi:hypothetical protein